MVGSTSKKYNVPPPQIPRPITYDGILKKYSCLKKNREIEVKFNSDYDISETMDNLKLPKCLKLIDENKETKIHTFYYHDNKYKFSSSKKIKLKSSINKIIVNDITFLIRHEYFFNIAYLNMFINDSIINKQIEVSRNRHLKIFEYQKSFLNTFVFHKKPFNFAMTFDICENLSSPIKVCDVIDGITHIKEYFPKLFQVEFEILQDHYSQSDLTYMTEAIKDIFQLNNLNTLQQSTLTKYGWALGENT